MKMITNPNNIAGLLFLGLIRQINHKMLLVLLLILNGGNLFILLELTVRIGYISNLNGLELDLRITYIIRILNAFENGVMIELDPSDSVTLLSEFKHLLGAYIVPRRVPF